MSFDRLAFTIGLITTKLQDPFETMGLNDTVVPTFLGRQSFGQVWIFVRETRSAIPDLDDWWLEGVRSTLDWWFIVP